MPRRTRFLTLALLVTALLTVGNASIAGAGSEQPTTKEWAKEVCSDISTWINSVEDTISSLEDADSLEDAASDASDGISDATDTLVSDLDDLGTPKTKNAQKVEKTLQQLEDQLEQDMETIEDALSDPGTTTVEVASTFAVIGTTVQHAIDQLKSAGETLKGLGANKEIQKAFESASSCKSLKESL